MNRALFLIPLLFAACKKAAPVEVPVEQQEAAAPVKAPPPQPAVAKTWVETDPVQCKGNAWEKFTGLGGITGFFDEKGVKVYDTATISFNQLYGEPVTTCRACTCPNGTALYLWVAVKDAPGMTAYGFKPATVDPLNPNSYVASRRPAGAPPLASQTPGPALKQGTTSLKKTSTAAPSKTTTKKKPAKKKRRTR